MALKQAFMRARTRADDPSYSLGEDSFIPSGGDLASLVAEELARRGVRGTEAAELGTIAGAPFTLMEAITDFNGPEGALGAVSGIGGPNLAISPALGRIKKVSPKHFFDLAERQRGLPESLMVKAQYKMGGGVMNPVIENAGDLTHRMAEETTFTSAGYNYVKPKVERLIRALEHPYGFMREFSENMAANAPHRGKTKEQLGADVIEALQQYAEAHKKLPVYNQAQELARGVAIDIGEMRPQEALEKLKILNANLESPEKWKAFAHEGLGKRMSDTLWSQGAAFKTEEGLPRPFFRGEEEQFDVYKRNFLGSHLKSPFRKAGFHFTPDKEEAALYATMKGTDIVNEAILGAEKPFTLDYDTWREILDWGHNKKYGTLAEATKAANSVVKNAKALGHDSLVILDRRGNPAEFVVFDPRQIRKTGGRRGP